MLGKGWGGQGGPEVDQTVNKGEKCIYLEHNQMAMELEMLGLCMAGCTPFFNFSDNLQA